MSNQSKHEVLKVYPDAYARARASGMIDIMDSRNQVTAMAIGCGKSDVEAWTDAGNRTGIAASKLGSPAETAESLPEPVSTEGAAELLGEVMHLWVDGYICKNPNSGAPDSISATTFEKISQYLTAEGMEVDYMGWRRVMPASSIAPVPARDAGDAAELTPAHAKAIHQLLLADAVIGDMRVAVEFATHRLAHRRKSSRKCRTDCALCVYQAALSRADSYRTERGGNNG